jgi:hypothetical protein
MLSAVPSSDKEFNPRDRTVALFGTIQVSFDLAFVTEPVSLAPTVTLNHW